MHFEKNGWSVVYERAIREDGSLFFPERLNAAFLEEQKRTLGTYIYGTQYDNYVIPYADRKFKKAWLKYYETLPTLYNRFAFIDPAISEKNTADYTALAIVDVDFENTWYVRIAKRARMTVTQQVQLIFDVNQKFKPNVIGIEIVAYQQALLQLIVERMRREKITLPVTGINRGGKDEESKHRRILSLVPRFEWGQIFVARNQQDFESEYLKFPKGKRDILDALSSIKEISYAPAQPRSEVSEPSPNDPGYEKFFIDKLRTQKAREQEDDPASSAY